VEWLLWWSRVVLKNVWQNSSSGGFLVAAGWSHQNVAPPPLWKPREATAPAPHPEPVQFPPFGRAPAGVARGAGAGALPNRPGCGDPCCFGVSECMNFVFVFIYCLNHVHEDGMCQSELMMKSCRTNKKIYIFPLDCSQPHKHWSRWGGHD
jgi:hypothetical protein